MKLLSMLNGDFYFGWGNLLKNLETEATDGTWSWLRPLIETLSTVLWVALALVGAAGAIYAVYVGIKMARAESAEQREENKKRLINIIVSIVVVLVLILFFNGFLPGILSAFGVFEDPLVEKQPVQTSVQMIANILHM